MDRHGDLRSEALDVRCPHVSSARPRHRNTRPSGARAGPAPTDPHPFTPAPWPRPACQHPSSRARQGRATPGLLPELGLSWAPGSRLKRGECPGLGRQAARLGGGGVQGAQGTRAVSVTPAAASRREPLQAPNWLSRACPLALGGRAGQPRARDLDSRRGCVQARAVPLRSPGQAQGLPLDGGQEGLSLPVCGRLWPRLYLTGLLTGLPCPPQRPLLSYVLCPPVLSHEGGTARCLGDKPALPPWRLGPRGGTGAVGLLLPRLPLLG